MRKYISTFIILFSSFLLYAQQYLPEVNSYTTKDGLSSDKIYALHKDSRGFLWVGTEEGLNRFDGQDFKVYSTDDYPNLTIKSIHGIFEEDEFLWLLKKNENYDQEYRLPEINLLNIYTDEITTPEKYFGSELPFLIKDIRFMKKLTDGQLYFYCESQQRIFTYSRSKGFQSFPHPSAYSIMSDLFLLDDGNLLINEVHTDSREWFVNKVDKKGNILAQKNTAFQLDLMEKGHSTIANFQNLYAFKGTRNLDLYHYFTPDFSEKKSTSDFSNIQIDQTEWNEDQQLFWIKGQNKITAIQPDGTVVFQREEEKLDVNKIPILFDGNTTWISNRLEGLVAINLERSHFTNYRFFERDFDNSTRGIHKDENGRVWVSTIAGYTGINADGTIDEDIERSQIFTRYMEDSTGNLWYFQNVHLIKYNLQTNQKTAYPIKGQFFESWSILKLSEEEVWINQFNGKIFKLNPQTGEMTTKTILPSNTSIGFHIYEYVERDAESLWLCTNQGLYIVRKDGQYLNVYNKEQDKDYYLPTRAIHHMYEDGDIVWLATGDAGLLKLRRNKFVAKTNTNQKNELVLEKQYTITDGLSSNFLHSIYEDDNDYLWISSDNGLMQFDKRSERVYKYFAKDGIQHNEFNRIAHFQAEDGQLYFGGLLGVTTFHPNDFSDAREQKNNAPFVITEFKQFSGKEEQFKDKTAAVIKNQEIVLQPDDRFFNLKIALLDFQADNTYQYRIRNLYDWQTNESGSIGISGLPYGNHILELKAFNNNQEEATNRLVLPIQVLRPFYLQWWFALLLIAGLGLGIWLFIKRRTRHILVQQEASQLKTLDQMKSRFFTNIAHELRTPLTLIGLPIDHLLRNLDDFSKEEMRQYLNSAKMNQQDLNRMINEILDLSKLESGKLEINQDTIELKAFIQRVVSVFQASAQSKEVQFRFSSFIPEKLLVISDLTKLEMIINNLLSNALKFTAKNGIIMVNANWQSNGQLYFTVQDNGRGIHPDDIPHIFDRYFQTNQKDKQVEGGSGIGLAICKEMLELLDGKIQVESTWKVGSTFSFYLPMTIADTLETPSTKAASLTKTITPIKSIELIPFSKDKLTLLIVEDHPEIRVYLKKILAPFYNILTATNGKEALELLPTANCQLIISDVMMPEMDGFSFLEKVKQDNRFCGIPFILLTARNAVQDKLHGLRIGVDAYMHKPFSPEELTLRIRNLLSNAKNRVEIIYQEGIAPTEHIEEIKELKRTAPSEVKVTQKDLEWLKSIEEIAQREVRNPNYNIENLAKELIMSRRQVFRKIKKITGLTPKKYLLSIRLQNAKLILETEEVSTLKEISYAVGFENTSHFAKLFEMEFGKRPHEFIKKSIL